MKDDACVMINKYDKYCTIPVCTQHRATVGTEPPPPPLAVPVGRGIAS